MLDRRHLVPVVTIADESLPAQELVEPWTADVLYRVGVASQLMLERAELLEQLPRAGAEIVIHLPTRSPFGRLSANSS